MQNAPELRISPSLIESLERSFYPDGIPPNSTPQLVVSLAPTNLSVRDRVAFLSHMERAFGRLTTGRLMPYAMRPKEHLRVTRVQPGSWKLIFEFRSLSILFILYLLIRYVPPAIVQASLAYTNYEQGRLARANRRRIDQEVREDARLRTLSPEHRRALVALLDALERADRDLLGRSGRFSVISIQNVSVTLRESDSPRNHEG